MTGRPGLDVRAMSATAAGARAAAGAAGRPARAAAAAAPGRRTRPRASDERQRADAGRFNGGVSQKNKGLAEARPLSYTTESSALEGERTPIRRLRGSVNWLTTPSFRKSGLVAVALGLAMTPRVRSSSAAREDRRRRCRARSGCRRTAPSDVRL